VIVHCAGAGSVAFSYENPYEDFQRTVSTTLEVLEFIRVHSPETKLVYPSSAAVYGIAKDIPISESHPLKPLSPYGSHKLMAENLCQTYATNFNISVAVIRLFSIFGPGLKKQLLWDACNKILLGENTFFGTGEEIRDWLFVEDAVTLLVKATEFASEKCPVVNGGAGEGITNHDILSQLFLFFEQTDEPKFSGEKKEGDPSQYIADIKIASSWGWKAEVDWRNGLLNYVEWFKENSLYD
jgi:UDP-glucose 4-epimerase